MDFRIKCKKCDHMVMITRVKFEKMVKKVLTMTNVLLLLLVFFTGCNATNENLPEETEQQAVQAFSLTREEQSQYLKKMTQVLDSFYWRYDTNTVLYNEGIVPDKDSVNYDRFVSACAQAEISCESYAGEEAVVTSIQLKHFNEDDAGTASFYFVEDEIAAVYYNTEYDSKNFYGLKSRNIFLTKSPFDKFENTDHQREFEEVSSKAKIEPFYSKVLDKNADTLIASIKENTIFIYRYEELKGFTKIKEVKGEDGFSPLSLTFITDSSGVFTDLAVLYGSLTQGFSEMESDELHPVYESKMIMLYDTAFKKKADTIELSSINCSFITYEDQLLVVSEGNSLVYYKYEGQWKKTNKTYITHSVKAYVRTDITGRGAYDYIMTDGLDLYVYKKEPNNNNYEMIWRTHISTERFFGILFVCDINGDGSKEIYIGDETATAIRYVVSEDGFLSYNDDILYGENIYACDFNNDGKDDYLKILDSETNQQKLFIAK